MIVDSFKNIGKYQGLDCGISEALTAASNLTADDATGALSCNGREYRCIISTYETRSAVSKKYEYHRRFADIQIVLDGEEKLYYAGSAECDGFDETADIGFTDTVAAETPVLLKPGMFCVLFPDEPHKPGCNSDAYPATVKKAVVKVRMN